MIAAGLLFVWEVDGAVVSMAAVTVAQDGVSRVGLVFTPAENRKRGFASVCVASLTARELATPGRTCMLYTDLANPNTHNLGWTEDADGAPDRQGGCGPVAVGGSFEVVVAHLAAYDAGVGA